ncbi:hypothetical protein BH10ACI1_BH10ACI1_28730 [soil metagenome]
MSRSGNLLKSLVLLFIFTLVFPSVFAQIKTNKPMGKAVMWERVNIKQRDLFFGPGGAAMRPDLSKITFIKAEKNGHNKKFKISDGSGKIWVAKLGREAQPETAAVRLLWALGYKTEINYLVPTLTIPGKGTFKNVRLEARPDNIERLDEWKWKDNPFIGTNELEGLKIMMVFFNNWDVLDLQNKVLKKGNDLEYIISDLGSTFGKLGNNNFPIIYRFGRKTNNPKKYLNSSFVDGVKKGEIDLAYKGKNRGLFKHISVSSARWLADLLMQLSDKQIEDAFRAANYSTNDIQMLKQGVKNRIQELNNAVNGENLAIR